MLLASFLLLFFLFITYLLLVPIDLLINTKTNQYYAQIKGLIKASIEQDKNEIVRIKLKLFYMNFYFYPLRYLGVTDRKKKIEKKNKNKKIKIGFRKGLQIIKSFKIKRFDLEIDTGDYILNAKLFPVFLFLNYKVGNFNVNFIGRNQLVLHLQNRPIYLIKSFINLKTYYYGITI